MQHSGTCNSQIIEASKVYVYTNIATSSIIFFPVYLSDLINERGHLHVNVSTEQSLDKATH